MIDLVRFTLNAMKTCFMAKWMRMMQRHLHARRFTVSPSAGDPDQIAEAVKVLASAERPNSVGG